MSAPFAPRPRGVRPSVLLLAAAVLLLWLAAVLVLGRGAQHSRPTPAAAPATAAETPSPSAPVVPPGSAAGAVRLYFAPPRAGDTDPIDQALVRLVNAAQTSVECAFYELELPAAADALIARHRAGVRVGMVSDSDYAKRPAIRACIDAGIPVVFDNRSAFMHDKFCIVDGRFVWTGSTNITENCMFRNSNNSLLIDSADLARDYAAEFGEMFSAGEFGPGSPKNTPLPEVTLSDGTAVECYFAPEDNAGDALVRLAASARGRVDFAAFSFTAQDLAEALDARMRAGVAVRGVFEKRGAFTPASRYAWLSARGANVHTDTNPASMHDKFLVVDSETVATGSFNFSRNADEQNDENLLILHSPALARRYVEEVDRLMN